MTLVQILYLFVGARIATLPQLQYNEQDVVQRRSLDPVGPVLNGELASFANFCLYNKSRVYKVYTERQWNSRTPNVSKTTETDK
jgi:hypothetical protein